ncbi:hypothetical protein DENSPDRAFT_829031 [Dentipellis sp. KUC8613]|nr:hypothetical protein DENSPDRAFT_829031 [Dentipellis sp. KUC8613]
MLLANPAVSASDYWTSAEKVRFTQQDGSCAGTPTDVLDTRRALELEINSIVLLMSSVCARFNALCPVNRLPPETLAHIFHFLRDPDTDPRAHPTGRIPRILTWVPAATHVCRQWRTAALEHPTLWSQIESVLDPEWKREFLRRSKAVPVVIRANRLSLTGPKEIIPTELAADIAHHLPHIRELSVDGAVNELAPIIQALDRPVPVLEKLVLSDLYVQHPPMGQEPMHVFLPEALSKFAPRLRVLTIQQWSFMWSSLAFTSLVHLTAIRPLWERSRGANDIEQLLLALQRMPALETLRLEYILPPLPARVMITRHDTCGPTVCLPRLRSIHMVDEVRKCGLILKHLTIPPTAKWHVSCIPYHEGYDFLLPWLATRINGAPLIRTLSLTEMSSGPTITAYNSDITNFTNTTDSFHGIDDREPPIFRLGFGLSVPFPVSHLQILLNAMPLQGVQVLSVCCDRVWSTQDWSTLFGVCSNLRHARIKYSRSRSLCKLLLTGSSPIDGGTALLYPHLEQLTLSAIRFREWRTEELSEWLEVQGIVKKLVIQDCSISTELVDRLKQVVPEVVWDGRDDLDEEEEEE